MHNEKSSPILSNVFHKWKTSLPSSEPKTNSFIYKCKIFSFTILICNKLCRNVTIGKLRKILLCFFSEPDFEIFSHKILTPVGTQLYQSAFVINAFTVSLKNWYKHLFHCVFEWMVPKYLHIDNMVYYKLLSFFPWYINLFEIT